MLNSLKSLVRRTLSGAAEAISLRRWDAAKTDRLNHAQWEGATHEKINDDIALDLPALRRRCLHEVQNNPFLEGVVGTHVVDVVGADGPTLQIESESAEYNETLEGIWQRWSEECDLAGDDTLVEFLQRDVRMLWQTGDFLSQIVDIPREDTPEGLPITLRMHEIHPRRLMNPFDASLDFRIIEGVERDQWGRPVAYYIEDFIADQGMLTGGPLGTARRIDARNIIHGFKKLEPGQVRGVPLAAPCLQTISDLRAYDAEVLDAARAAAHFSVLLYTDHPDSKYMEVNESTDMERRTIRTVPPGWKVSQLQPHQPQTGYIDYRAERLREVGRPAQMPLMMVTLDSSGHNYSSARFDAQRYDRSNTALQKWITRKKLTRLLKLVQRQADLEQLLPARPKVVKFQWTWPVSPHVDPSKEADAWDTLLTLGIVSEFDAAAALGKDYETVVQLRKRAKELREAAGLMDPREQQLAEAEAAGKAGANGANGGGAAGANGKPKVPAETRKMVRRLVEQAFEERNRGERQQGVFRGVLTT